MDQEAQEKLEALLRLFREHRLEELLVEQGGLKVHLRTGRAEAPAAPRREPRAAPSRPLPTAGRKGRTVAVRSPLIGIFYQAATLDAPPFVEVGDVVEEGQTVCVVEAMKVFNEIKAEWSGRVVAIPAANGKLVQAGEPLVVLEFVD